MIASINSSRLFLFLASGIFLAAVSPLSVASDSQDTNGRFDTEKVKQAPRQKPPKGPQFQEDNMSGELDKQQTRLRLEKLIKSAVSRGLVEQQSAKKTVGTPTARAEPMNEQPELCAQANPVFLPISEGDDVLGKIHAAHQTMLGEFDAVRTDALHHLVRVYLSVGMTDELRKLIDGFSEEIDTPDVYLAVAERIDGPFQQPSGWVYELGGKLGCDKLLRAFESFTEHEKKLLDTIHNGLWKFSSVHDIKVRDFSLSAGNLRQIPFPILIEIEQRVGIVAALAGDWNSAIELYEGQKPKYRNTDHGRFLKALIAWYAKRPEDTYRTLETLAQSATPVSAEALIVFWHIFYQTDGAQLQGGHSFRRNIEAVLDLLDDAYANRLELLLIWNDLSVSEPSPIMLTQMFSKISTLDLQSQDRTLRDKIVVALIEKAFMSNRLENMALVSEWLLDENMTVVSPEIRDRFRGQVEAFLDSLENAGAGPARENSPLPETKAEAEIPDSQTPSPSTAVNQDEIPAFTPDRLRGTLVQTQTEIDRIEALLENKPKPGPEGVDQDG